MVFGDCLYYSVEKVLKTIISGSIGIFSFPAINQVWSTDFVQDALFKGTRFRILAVVDDYTKKCLSLVVGQSLRGSDVRNELGNIALIEGTYPIRIQCDNGSEFISKESINHPHDQENRRIIHT
jgi:transposase InsO family protein